MNIEKRAGTQILGMLPSGWDVGF
ncbi:hypothetical protein HALA3H3_800149 [Halomonas sp. A3H3]|nr:hypothetical protein HALA3H3_800149 [Halomonas sp. A3H3]